MKRMTKEEWMERAMRVRNLSTGRLLFLLMAMSEGIEPDAKRFALSMALQLPTEELDRAHHELVAVGLAELIPSWIN